MTGDRIRYLSVFSGIEAASMAWEPLGWVPMAFAEVDEFPSAVLAHRYPDVPNLGDVCKVDWGEFVEDRGRPDVIVGGSPCQSFSVAAGTHRTSLDGESNLMFEYLRAVGEVRPEWLVWENVPGVLRTRDNAFVQLLDTLQDLGYGLAWRVLDAQFFGVAQRRRRVFLVGHLGRGGSAAAVLFEQDSVRGNITTSKKQREELAAAARDGTQEGRGERVAKNGRAQVIDYKQTPKVSDDLCHTLTREGDGGIHTAVGYETVCMASASDRAEICDDMSPTLLCRQYKDPPIVARRAVVTNYGEEIAGTLTARHDSSACADRGQNVLCIPINTVVIDRAAYNQGENAAYTPHIEETDVMDPLIARGPHAVGYESGETRARDDR